MNHSEVLTWLGKDEVTAILAACLILLLFKLWLEEDGGGRRPKARLPPGPLGNHLPILGYLPFLGTRPVHEHLTELAKKYGKVFRVRLGSKNMVVISCHRLLKQVFKNNEFINRPHSPLGDGVMDGYGITASEGQLWKTQRQFALLTLKQLGMLRSASRNSDQFKGNICTATDLLLQELDRSGGEPMDIDNVLAFSVANIYTSTVVSKTFDLYDPRLMTQIHELEDSFRMIDSVSVVNLLPIFRHWPKFKRVLGTLLERRESTRNFHRQLVAEHRAQLDPENPRDLIDAFLIQMDKDNMASKQTHFHEIQLLSMLGDLISAGTETIKTTLLWLFLAMIKHPDIQLKVQNELDNVIGTKRCPTSGDLQQLPYFQAVIFETLRMSSIVPLGAPRCPVRDTTIDGYHIPKDSLVVGLLWKFHHDPDTWQTPEVFDPNHFLTADGSIVKRDDLLPFSTGRRSCIGEDIARHEIFIIAASVLQRFKLLPPEGLEPPSLNESRPGFLRAAFPYKLRIIPRL